MAHGSPIDWNTGLGNLQLVNDGLPEPQTPSHILPLPIHQHHNRNERNNAFFSTSPYPFQNRSEPQRVDQLFQSLQTHFHHLSERIQSYTMMIEELKEDNRRLQHVVDVREGQLLIARNRAQEVEEELGKIRFQKQSADITNKELVKAVECTSTRHGFSTLPIICQIIGTHLDLEPMLRQTRVCSDLQHPGTEQCPICRDSTGNVVQLPCSHALGGPCLRTWVVGGNTCCPMCRRAIPEVWIRFLESAVLLTNGVILGSPISRFTNGRVILLPMTNKRPNR